MQYTGEEGYQNLYKQFQRAQEIGVFQNYFTSSVASEAYSRSSTFGKGDERSAEEGHGPVPAEAETPA